MKNVLQRLWDLFAGPPKGAHSARRHSEPYQGESRDVVTVADSHGDDNGLLVDNDSKQDIVPTGENNVVALPDFDDDSMRSAQRSSVSSSAQDMAWSASQYVEYED